MPLAEDLELLVEALELIRDGRDPYSVARALRHKRLSCVDESLPRVLKVLARGWGRIALLRKAIFKLGLPMHRAHRLAIGIYLATEGLLPEADVLSMLASELRPRRSPDDVRARLRAIYDRLLASEREPAQRAILEHYLPPWLADRLARLLGEQLVELCRAFRDRRLWIRVNTLKATPEEVRRLLEAEGISLEEDEDFDFVFKVPADEEARLRASKPVREGLCFVQDKGSVAAVVALDPQPGETVVDFCAAPGMKTSLIAQLMEGRGRIVAIDISPRRLGKLRATLHLAGAANVEVILADSRKLRLLKADRALVDPPCTSTGALEKDPTIALRLRRRHVRRYSRIQRDILENVLPQASVIVYSVCSLLPEEGEMLIDTLLREGLRLERPKIRACPGYPGFRCSQDVARLFPHVHGCDGFFIARLAR